MFGQVTLIQAFRNVSRHARRSAIALASVGFGVVAMLLAAGFIEDILHGMREAFIETQLGHVQITRPRYLQEGLSAPFQYLIPEDPAVIARALALVEPFEFETVYGGWWRRVVDSDAKAALRRSAERYRRHIGLS